MFCNMTHVSWNTAMRFCTVGFAYVGIPFALWLQSNCDGTAAMLVTSMVARFLMVRCVDVPVVTDGPWITVGTRWKFQVE